MFLGFPCGSAGKEAACNAGDLGSIDPLEKGKATHSGILENSMDYAVHGVTKSQTLLSHFHFPFLFTLMLGAPGQDTYPPHASSLVK